ncbi:hypothetical protein PQ478_09295 [Alkalihalophilus pseudofirmus]|uniref:DUF7446 family protein n=1 Tax=Alkalihalophilus pseudofirmus TaxID=79885 RepID=UPI00259BB54F|nr:hypothetical protein [Alkalihalophilus pseudofirmus]WEG18664.1 hypothetical protein PQ478_09295 [Alkalihalophilus pseudofirmus]
MNELRIAKSALTDNVYAGRLRKDGFTWKEGKVDVTNDFIAAVIARWNGYEETLVAGDKKYKVSVVELND